MRNLLDFVTGWWTNTIGEIVVASPYMEGTRMYFDEKIARYEIKKSVGLVE